MSEFDTLMPAPRAQSFPSRSAQLSASSAEVAPLAQHGGPGDDLLLGGEGNDELWGHEGADRIDGGRGDDRLHGDAGDDLLEDRWGRNVFDGGDGKDEIFAGG